MHEHQLTRVPATLHIGNLCETRVSLSVLKNKPISGLLKCMPIYYIIYHSTKYRDIQACYFDFIVYLPDAGPHHPGVRVIFHHQTGRAGVGHGAGGGGRGYPLAFGSCVHPPLPPSWSISDLWTG